jgi:predicted GIY-YIG superfamily endonuclease
MNDSKTPNRDLRWNEGSGFVYAIQTPDGQVKIGRTVDMKTRLNVYNTHLPKYEVLKVIWVEEEAQWVEHKLHTAFKQYKLVGEWFQLDQILVKRLMRLMKAEGIPQHEAPPHPQRPTKSQYDRKQAETRTCSVLDKISEKVKQGPRKRKTDAPTKKRRLPIIAVSTNRCIANPAQ